MQPGLREIPLPVHFGVTGVDDVHGCAVRITYLVREVFDHNLIEFHEAANPPRGRIRGYPHLCAAPKMCISRHFTDDLPRVTSKEFMNP